MTSEDPPHAGEVYRALAPAVLGYLRAQGVADPDDLLGDVFLSVAASIHRFHGDELALRRWVFTIAHNRIVDERRRRSRRAEELTSEPVDNAAEHLPDPVDSELLDALSNLSADQREVVILRFVADLSLDDVARITRRKVGAVKALQHRALDNLSRALEGRAGKVPR